MVIGKPPAGQLYVWLCAGPQINITNNINTTTYISRPAAATNKDNRREKDGTESDCSPNTQAQTLYRHLLIFQHLLHLDWPMGYFSRQFYSVALSFSRCLQQHRNKETNKMEIYDKPARCVLVLILSWCISLCFQEYLSRQVHQHFCRSLLNLPCFLLWDSCSGFTRMTCCLNQLPFVSVSNVGATLVF